MEFNFFTRCVVLLVVVEVGFLEATQSHSDWLARSVDSVRREKRTKDKVEVRAIADDKNGESKERQKAGDKASCCFNGGICIMNTFCHCKKNFYGRYCEHRVRHQSCGTIRHGTWMAAGCHLCHCFDGKMTCKVTEIKGCDKLSYVEGYEKDPDYMVGIDKKAEDYEAFYEEYDYGVVETSQASGACRNIPMLLSAVSVAILWLAS